MRFLGSTKKMLTKIKKVRVDSQNLQMTVRMQLEVTFVPNKQFGQLINISPHSLMMMNTVNTEFSSVDIWSTDQASKALEIEDNVNLTLIIGQAL